MKLHYYFARRFFWTFVALLVIFSLFQALLDLIEELSRFSDTASFSQIVGLTALKLPGGIYQILPLVMILSSIALFLNLARTSELVVARATGRPGLVTVMGPLFVTIVIGAFAVSVVNPIVAATSKRYAQLSESYDSKDASVLSVGREGLWLRQGGPGAPAVIHARRSNPDATELFRVTLIAYDADGNVTQRILASKARLEDGKWKFQRAKVWQLDPSRNAEASAERHAEFQFDSDLTQDNIKDRFGQPSAIPIWELPNFIDGLEAAGFSARRHIVWLQMEAASPLFLVAMLLIGAGFTMRPTRMGRTGLSVLAAVMLGFGLYYVRNFAQIMGENGQIAPVLAAWTPPFASVLMALGLLLHMEDG